MAGSCICLCKCITEPQSWPLRWSKTCASSAPLIWAFKGYISKGFNCKQAHWSCLISVLLGQSCTWSGVFFNEFPMALRALLPLKTTWRPVTRVIFPVHQELLQNVFATAHWSAIVLDLTVKAQLDSISCFIWDLWIKPCLLHVKYCLLMFLDETENWRL